MLYRHNKTLNCKRKMFLYIIFKLIGIMSAKKTPKKLKSTFQHICHWTVFFFPLHCHPHASLLWHPEVPSAAKVDPHDELWKCLLEFKMSNKFCCFCLFSAAFKASLRPSPFSGNVYNVWGKIRFSGRRIIFLKLCGFFALLADLIRYWSYSFWSPQYAPKVIF